MDRAERVLYHQIHPAKLATDLTAEVASTVLLWRHRIVAGLLVRLVPALVASAVLMRRTEDLERLRDSAAGRYVHDHMTPQAEGVRALGDVLTAIGAWRRRPFIIVLGWAVIAAGWSGGLLRGRAASSMPPNGA
jgi:HAMP domain-containing protein